MNRNIDQRWCGTILLAKPRVSFGTYLIDAPMYLGTWGYGKAVFGFVEPQVLGATDSHGSQ